MIPEVSSIGVIYLAYPYIRRRRLGGMSASMSTWSGESDGEVPSPHHRAMQLFGRGSCVRGGHLDETESLGAASSRMGDDRCLVDLAVAPKKCLQLIGGRSPREVCHIKTLYA